MDRVRIFCCESVEGSGIGWITRSRKDYSTGALGEDFSETKTDATVGP